MNFGVRLPGPFRAGISSSGQWNAGVTLGPVSASTNVGGRAQASGEVFAPVHILDALAELLDAGWKVDGRGDDWALVHKGLQGLRLRAVDGGTVARRATTRRAVVMWTVLVVGLLVACGAWLG